MICVYGCLNLPAWNASGAANLPYMARGREIDGRSRAKARKGLLRDVYVHGQRDANA
jgi:hypothetical protein